MSIPLHISSWLGRLKVGKKLLLIYLLDLTAVIYVSGILINEKYLAIDFARKEIRGNAYANVVRESMLAIAAPADGDPPAGAATLRAETILQAESAWGEGMQSAEPASAYAERLTALNQPTGDRSEKLTREAMKAARALLTRISNQSNLILDPDLDSYYAMSLVVLRFPDLVEVIADAMATLRRGLSERDLSRQRSEYLVLAGRLDSVTTGIRSDFAEAVAASKPLLATNLDPLVRQLLTRVDRFRAQVERLSDADPHQRDAAAAALPQAEGALLDMLAPTWARTAAELDRLLHIRVAWLFKRMWLHLGTALLLLTVILSIVYFVARQIAVPLRRLSDVADGVRRTGDHTLRAQWNSGDEIGSLYTAFNEMLEQLDRERIAQQELAARARAAQAQQQLLEAIPIPLVVTSIPEHEVLRANDPAKPWLAGCDRDPWGVSLDSDVRARFFQRLADRGHVEEFEARWRRGSDRTSWAVLSATRLEYQGRDAILTAFTPINVLKSMEQRLELWAKVFEASFESIVIMDTHRRVVSVKRAFCRSTSYEFHEAVNESFENLLMLDDARTFLADVEKALARRDAWQGEVTMRRRTGGSYPAWLMLSAVREPGGGPPSHFIAISIDITDRRQSERRIEFLALHDVLTELPNRSLCGQRLKQAIDRAAGIGGTVAVLFLDLDRFKNINDSLGHHVGDELLRSVSQRLRSVSRAEDTVARLGGDEFVLVLEGVDRAAVADFAELRLIPTIRRPHEVLGNQLHVSCSVGIALYPSDGADLETLMRNADAAMYEAKATGRDMACFFSDDIHRRLQDRMLLERELRGAIERGELTLHYQPRVDARDGTLLGAEALLRWTHDELGAVPPSRFIPVAEECGLIRPIGVWVIERACAQQARWHGNGLPRIPVSINLSAAQLQDPDLLPQLRSSMSRHGVAAGMLELEVTESLLMDDSDQTLTTLSQLKAIGLTISVDDFGTGYSSLNYLKNFPIDRLKIDQSFVRDMLTDPTDLAITKAIIGLGHTLGLKVVAEGVEEQAQVRALQAARCDELQGYFYGRPMDETTFERWVADRTVPEENAAAG